MKSRQWSLFENVKSKSEKAKMVVRYSHGGSLRAGKQKLVRPLDKRKPVHLVLKSSCAKGRLSLLGPSHQLRVGQIFRERAEMYGVKIHRLENMGNHIHAVLSFTCRELIQKFLRVVSGLIAKVVTGAKRGRPFGRKFWDALAFTGVVNGRRDFQSLMGYMGKNALEREDPIQRASAEFYESLERKVRRRGCDVDVVLEEWRERVRY